MHMTLIGQDVPALLPTLLTDLLFAGKETNARVTAAEPNPAMRDLLEGYGKAVFRKAGLPEEGFRAEEDREKALEGADCVIYAGDCQPSSRFDMDRSALMSDDEENDPGLSDQARVNGGLGGLLHALRAGEEALNLCDVMDRVCPNALVISLGQPAARVTAVFLNRGYRCYGLGRTPLKGANGLDTLAKRMKLDPDRVTAEIAGLPGFAFLLGMKDGRKDVTPRLRTAVKNGELGNLAKRWMGWWDAIPVGDVTDHAEFLPAQPDYIPEERPAFGESVERRRERILWMNTVREKGAEDREGAMAQLLLLSKAPPIRPMRLALALLRKETAVLPAVIRRNGNAGPGGPRALAGLPAEAVIEAELRLEEGCEVPSNLRLPEALTDILIQVDEANRLAARAAAGDLSALRQCVEEEPALEGLDRLYCMDVVKAMIAMHRDVLPRLADLIPDAEEEPEAEKEDEGDNHVSG